MKRLNIENPFFAFMGRLGDIAILNLLFLLCSIPILTIGPSLAAMYQAFREMQEGESPSAWRAFFAAFQSAMKKSLIPWLFQLLAGVVLAFDLMFVVKAESTVFWHTVGMLLGCMFLLWMMISCYLLPAGAYREKSLGAALSKSLSLAVRNFPFTIVMALFNSIPGICILLGSYFIGTVTPIYLTIGFGATAYLNTFLLRKCKTNGTIAK